MAYSYDIAVASGSTAVFTVPFPYIHKSHVHVTVEGFPVADDSLVWLTENTILLPTTPGAGTRVRRYRRTPNDSSPVTFSPGYVNSADLNVYARHMLYAIQEAYDAGAESYQITDQILQYLDTISNMVVQAEEAAQEASTSNGLVQTALAEVQTLRDEVVAIVGLSASGVTNEAVDWLTSTNVQASLAMIAAAITSSEDRLDALEDWRDGDQWTRVARIKPGTGVAAVDVAWPSGASFMKVRGVFRPSSAGAVDLGVRFSTDGGETYKGGSSDYFLSFLYQVAGAVGGNSGQPNNYIPLSFTTNSLNLAKINIDAQISQGSEADFAQSTSRTTGLDTTAGGQSNGTYSGYMTTFGEITHVRFLARSGYLIAPGTDLILEAAK